MSNPFEIIERRLSSIEDVLQDLRRNGSTPTSPPLDHETPLGVRQAADFLNVSPQTVYQRIKKIPHKKRFGKLYFYASDLRAYIDGGEGADNE